MPKVTSKAQQKKLALLMKQKKITKEEFDRRAVSGAAYDALPENGKKKKVS